MTRLHFSPLSLALALLTAPALAQGPVPVHGEALEPAPVEVPSVFRNVGRVAAGGAAQQEETWRPQGVRNAPKATRVAKDTPGTLAGPTRAITRGVGMLERDGVLRGMGPSYDITFEVGAVEFTPALGQGVERDMPLRFTLESIQRGGDTLYAVDRAPRPVRHGNSVHYTHPGGLVERYDVRAEGVEQSFVLATRPTGSGDVVVRGRIATALDHVPGSAANRGLRFVAEGIGGVEFGAVTGVSADGRQAAGSLRYDAGVLELTLPHDFVEAASYPMVLDPQIGTFFVVATSWDDTDADVAYDATHDVYLVVWRRSFSATNSGIRGQRVDGASGALVGGMLGIATATSTYELNPTVANVNQTDRFLVAWQTGSSAVGPWDIHAVCVDAGTGAVSLSAVVAGGRANEINPDAASDPTGTDNEAVLVWEETGVGIVGAQVGCASGTGAPVPFVGVTISANSNDGRPAISKSASLNYLVAYERQQATSLGVFARAITRNMMPGTKEVSIANVANIDEARPDVDGDGAEFVVVFQRDESIGSSNSDIVCRRISVSGLVPTVSGASTVIAEDATIDQREPAIGLLGPRYLIAWMELIAMSNYDIGLVAVSPDDCADCGLRIIEAGGIVAVDGFPEIGSKLAGGSSSDECLVTFGEAEVGLPVDSDILAFRFEALGAGGPIVSVPGGCGVATTIGTSGGAFASGNSRFAFNMTGAEPAVTTAIFALGARGNTFKCGRCEILLPVISLGIPVVNGKASLPVPVSCDPIFIGGFFEVQWWPIGTSQTPCVFLPTASLSDRLDVTVGL